MILWVLVQSVSMSHPLTLSFLVLFFRILRAVLFYRFSYKWLFCALILVYLGGIIILFIYVSALRIEDKVVFRLGSESKRILFLVFLCVQLPSFSLWGVYNSNCRSLQGISCLYDRVNSCLLGLLMCYLLLSLFSVVKIRESFKGTLNKTHGSFITS